MRGRPVVKVNTVPIAVLLLFSSAAIGHAQPAAEAPRDDAGYIGRDVTRLEIDDCPALPDLSKDRIRQVASEHYQRGEVLYAEGDYKGAVEELVSAYCLSPYYTVLKDIGQAYERQLEYEKAIGYLSRYVFTIPKNAQRASQCDVDPQADAKLVKARISVLEGLRAEILVDTSPPHAKLTLSNDAGVHARGESGSLLEVAGGRYTLTIELDGYVTAHREIAANIGKPYTYFERLEPQKGELRVQVTPNDARLFLDKRSVGTGRMDEQLPAGKYSLVVELADHVSQHRDVVVVPNHTTAIAIELAGEPQFGHRQLLVYGGVAGAVAGGALLGTTSDPGVIGVGISGGAAAGLLGTLYGTPHDLALGTSDLTITSSLIGGVVGLAAGSLFTDKTNILAPLGGGGLVLGAGVGYYVADRLHTRPGEAAVVNSGALWGTAAGALFVASFQPDTKISAGIVLSGLGMGTVGGVLLARYFRVSRAHAALIDVGGLVGALGGVAAENLIFRQQNQTSSQQVQNEHTADFALGGLAVGLILAGVFTRELDLPKIAVTPAIGTTASPDGKTSSTTFGVRGAF